MNKDVSPFSVEAMVLNHEGRIQALEKLAWKLVGGIVVGSALGTTIGGAFVAWLLGQK